MEFYYRNCGYSETEISSMLGRPAKTVGVSQEPVRKSTPACEINEYQYDEERSEIENLAREIVGMKRVTLPKMRKYILDMLEMMDDDAF
jgi:hypothetical protein